MALGIVTTMGGIGTEELASLQKSIADAKTTANGAQQTATDALTKANAASTTADSALSKAGGADTKATQALEKATAADTKAGTADTNATKALEAANTAKTEAGDAKAAAEAAQEKAQSVADSLKKLTNTISALPTQAGSLTYTGQSQTPSWNGYDATQLTLSVTGQTNAGSYTASFTPKDEYEWWDGTKTAKTASWTIKRKSVPYPTQSGTLTYKTTAQSPSWTNYNSNELTLSGTPSETDAGNYTASFTPKGNWCWPDGTFAAHSSSWSIQKASYTLGLSTQTVNITGASKTATVNVTKSGTGAVSAVSKAAGTATTSVSGTTITITGVANGSTTVTVSVAADKNYNAPATKDITVTVKLPVIYGVEWDGNSGTGWSRTDASARFSDPVPAVNSKGGSSPFDSLMPWSGMTVSARTGGQMVAIPKFWYKLTQNGNGLKIQISDGAQAGFSVSPAHNRAGKVYDTIYVGKYHCKSSTYKSETGAIQVNMTHANARTGCQKIQSGHYYMMDFATRFTIWLLYLVEFANWNSQAKIGGGCSPSGTIGQNGVTDSITYHTGTTAATLGANVYGWTKYRNIEGLWDNVFDWLDGCYYGSGGLYIQTDPSKFSDNANGTAVGVATSGWPSKFTVSDKAGFPMFYPTQSSGSASTYACDYWYANTSASVLFAGGDYGHDGNYGLFYVNYLSLSYASGNVGARLLELP